MQKSLIRVVAILLVHCLMADPATASAFSTSPIDISATHYASHSTGIFCKEALIARRLGYEHAPFFLSHPFRSLGELFRDSERSVRQPIPATPAADSTPLTADSASPERTEASRRAAPPEAKRIDPRTVQKLLNDLRASATTPRMEFFSADKTPLELLVMHLAPYAFGKKQLPLKLRDKVAVTSEPDKFIKGKLSNDGKFWLYIENPTVVDASLSSFGSEFWKESNFIKGHLEANEISSRFGYNHRFKFVLKNGKYEYASIEI